MFIQGGEEPLAWGPSVWVQSTYSVFPSVCRPSAGCTDVPQSDWFLGSSWLVVIWASCHSANHPYGRWCTVSFRLIPWVAFQKEKKTWPHKETTFSCFISWSLQLFFFLFFFFFWYSWQNAWDKMYSIQVKAELCPEKQTAHLRWKKLLSWRASQGDLFTSSSRKAGMCAGNINTTCYKHIPQMNRIIGAEQAVGGILLRPGRLRELVTHAWKCPQNWKITPSGR